MDPPPPLEKVGTPLENVGPPLEPWKTIVFFEINHWTSVIYKLRTKKKLSEFFSLFSISDGPASFGRLIRTKHKTPDIMGDNNK